MAVQLDDIALFLEVARRKSITRTAEHLREPASTVSRRLRRLETELGMRLLNRTTRRMELTEMGERYFERCLPLIEQAQVAHETLTEQMTQPKGRLRLSIPASFAALVLPKLLPDFSAAYPEILCDIDVGMQRIDAVDNPFDVALRFGEQPDSGLVSRPVLMLDHWLFASPEYLDKHGRPRSPEDLLRHQCLQPFRGEDMERWRLRRGLQTQEVAVNCRIAINNIGIMATLARQGAGIAPIPNHQALNPMAHDSALERVLPQWHLPPIALSALLPSRTVPARTQVFLDYLASVLARAEPAAAWALSAGSLLGVSLRS